MDAKKLKRLIQEVELVLWEDWDPIGVNGEPRAISEYDMYARPVLEVALKTRSIKAILEQLVEITHKRMGFPNKETVNDLAAAEKILKLVEQV